MVLFNSFTIVLILSSVAVAEADDDGAWKQEMEQKMEEVLRLVQRQENMIVQRDRVIERQSLTIEKHSKEIGMLKRSIEEMKLGCKGQHVVQRPESKADNSTHQTSNEVQKSQGGSDSKRLLLPVPQDQVAVAFYAYMSKNFGHVGSGHVYIYDTIVTNAGNAYNHHTGIFTAPHKGLYAFSWTIFASGEHVDGETGEYGEVTVHLVQNGQYRGSIYADTETNYEEEMTTGFAILSLDAGDVVMVTTPSGAQGSFRSDTAGRWSFSGFRVA